MFDHDVCHDLAKAKIKTDNISSKENLPNLLLFETTFTTSATLMKRP